jgi:hypothetical protein
MPVAVPVEAKVGLVGLVAGQGKQPLSHQAAQPEPPIRVVVVAAPKTIIPGRLALVALEDQV